MPAATVYDELIDFIASGASQQAVASFQVSENTRERAWHLLDREKAGEASPEEASELNHYLELEHIVRMAKARAKRALRDHP